MLKNKRFRKVVIILLIIALIVGLIVIKPTSADSVFSLTEASYELDKTNPGRVTVSINVPYTGTYVSFQGRWSASEIGATGEAAETNYFTLVSHELVKNAQFRDSWQESYYYLDEEDDENDEPDYAYWVAKNTDSNERGLKYTAGDTIWTATYEIDKDTPAGEYYVGFRGLNTTIYDGDNEKLTINNEWTQYVVAKVTVTRAKTAVTPIITKAEDTYTFNGSQITPEITVTDSTDTNIVLAKDTDYTVSYGTNLFAGENTGSITISPVETSDYTFTETTVNFDIAKANSALTPEQIAMLTSLLRVPAGAPLSTIPVATYGGQWVNEETVIALGQGNYPAYYLQNGDDTNYNIAVVNVPVYGQSIIKIDTEVEGGNGTIAVTDETINLATVVEDTQVEFTLTPDEEYKVDTVTVDGVPTVVTDNKVTVTAGNTDMEVVATFKPQREDLIISGIEDNQVITYTAQPVVLVGSLSVSENDDDITVSDLTTTWYQGTEEIEQPTTVGTYKVVYSYYGDNYKGNLVVNFEIIKADSVVPDGTIEMIASRLKLPAGTPLIGIDVTPYGAAWVDNTGSVLAGSHTYPALYVTNGDVNNYNLVSVDIPIYGLSYVDITTSVDGGHGSISESLTNILEGTTQNITLTPEDGYKVDTVKVNGETVTVSENQVTITAGASNMTVVAKFKVAQEDLFISGMEDEQEITYTGSPVVLEGNLVVAENDNNITVDDITTTYYKVVSDGDMGELVEIEEAPVNVGSYQVVYSYEDPDYKGELTVNFEIVKADSVVPEGALEMIAARLKVPVGTSLTTLDVTPYGASWVNAETSVTAGANTYPAIYVTNGDVANYNPTNVEIPVYGLSFVDITTSVDGENGTITESFENVLEGTEKTIEIIPEDGYQIKEVTVDGEAVTVSSNQITVTAGNKNMTVVAKFERIPFQYEYLEGNGQTYTQGTDAAATFKIDAELSLLDKVYVDDLLVETSNYTTKSGSTIITFTKAFMDTLTAGTHTLKVTYKDNGQAVTTFTVKAAEVTTVIVDSDTTKTATDTTTGTAATTETATTTQTTSSTPKTGDKVLVDIYIAIVSGLGLFMFIDHKLNSKPRKSTRRRK